MSQPFVGSIMMFGGNFAPQGWSTCAGQILSIADYDALFNLIGTTYGGDGITGFALPNMQSRVPINMGRGPGLTLRTLGEAAGAETVSLTQPQLPMHSHMLMAYNGPGNQTALGSSNTLANQVIPSIGQSGNAYVYAPGGTQPQVAMSPVSVGTAGYSQGHNNIQPVLGLLFCISLFGLYPSA
ncbi:MAG TPA: tail fiber protein [Rhizomicrobium sp.]|jgi:microcystin-dependent protein